MWRTVLAVVTFVCMASSATAATCISDPEGVRHLYPTSYPSWTDKMPGHKNEKCWFPAPDRWHKKWDPKFQDKMPEVVFEHLKTSKVKSIKELKQSVAKIMPTDIKQNVTTQQMIYTVSITPSIEEIFMFDKQLSPNEAVEICNLASSKLKDIQLQLQLKYKKLASQTIAW